ERLVRDEQERAVAVAVAVAVGEAPCCILPPSGNQSRIGGLGAHQGAVQDVDAVRAGVGVPAVHEALLIAGLRHPVMRSAAAAWSGGADVTPGVLCRAAGRIVDS